MAINKMSENIKNAMIDLEGRKIVETVKDETKVYDLDKFLQRWNGVEGVTISITKNTEIKPDSEEY